MPRMKFWVNMIGEVDRVPKARLVIEIKMAPSDVDGAIFIHKTPNLPGLFDPNNHRDAQDDTSKVIKTLRRCVSRLLSGARNYLNPSFTLTLSSNSAPTALAFSSPAASFISISSG